MPVFIGDVLESCGGPILDLSTQQVKGLGVFNSVSDRNDLNSLMRSTGYLSVVGNTYPQISVHTGGDWSDSDNWDTVLKDAGYAVKLENFSGEIPQTVTGFLIGDLGQYASFLRKGDVFHVKGLHDASDSLQASGGRRVNDGSYLVVDDPWTYGGSPNVSIPKSPNYGDAIASLLDYVDNGSVVKLSSTKPLIKTLPSADSLIGADGELNQTLLSNTNPAQIPVSILTETGVTKDAKITIAQFISMLGAGIADNYVASGYGDITSYGGSAGVISSGGDIDGDGIIGVSDILSLLSSFGLEAETETELTNTVVDIPQSLGTNNQQNLASSYTGPFWSGDSNGNRFHMFKDWGSGTTNFTNTLPFPSVTNGAASVTFFNVGGLIYYTSSALTTNNITLGDPIVFAGEESNGFQINAFPNNPSRLIFKEGSTVDNHYQLFAPPLAPGFKNFITISSSQATDFNASSDLQVILRIKKYSQEPANISSLTSNVIDTRVVVVGSTPFSSLGVPNSGGEAFFNFNASPHIPNSEATETDISELYLDQHGVGLFETEGGQSCVAIGVEFGVVVTNVNSSTSRNLPQNVHTFGEFGVAYYSAAIIQNHQMVLVPHP